jgi:hypothetical protein
LRFRRRSILLLDRLVYAIVFDVVAIQVAVVIAKRVAHDGTEFTVMG